MRNLLSLYKNGVCITDRIEQGNTFFRRFKGLMWRKSISPDEGFYLTPCRSIHTFEMRFPIDVLFLSKNGTVLCIEREMPPCRVTAPIRKAESTLELAAKAADRYGIAVGDRLVFK